MQKSFIHRIGFAKALDKCSLGVESPQEARERIKRFLNVTTDEASKSTSRHCRHHTRCLSLAPPLYLWCEMKKKYDRSQRNPSSNRPHWVLPSLIIVRRWHHNSMVILSIDDIENLQTIINEVLLVIHWQHVSFSGETSSSSFIIWKQRHSEITMTSNRCLCQWSWRDCQKDSHKTKTTEEL